MPRLDAVEAFTAGALHFDDLAELLEMGGEGCAGEGATGDMRGGRMGGSGEGEGRATRRGGGEGEEDWWLVPQKRCRCARGAGACSRFTRATDCIAARRCHALQSSTPKAPIRLDTPILTLPLQLLLADINRVLCRERHTREATIRGGEVERGRGGRRGAPCGQCR